jgi:hypothetical protein
MKTKKSKQIKHEPLKSENYYGVFNHMIEDNLTYLTGCNSFNQGLLAG